MKKWKMLSRAKKALCLFYAAWSFLFFLAGILALFKEDGRGGLFLTLAICFLLLWFIHLHRGDDNKSVF